MELGLPLNTYKAVIQYLGTDYKGFQKQKFDTQTIQNSIEKVLKIITKEKEIYSLGSGRTDAGVHACGQVIKIMIQQKIPSEGMKRAMNDLLTRSIRVSSLNSCEGDFHPIRDSYWKEYRYRFCLNEELDPFINQQVTNFKGKLNVDLMVDACGIFIGKHDFAGFQTVGTEVNSTIREIHACEVRKLKPSQNILSGRSYQVYELSIVGSGFLKQMVRLIMGTLLEVSKGKVGKKQIISSLSSSSGEKVPCKLGAVAPPEGLTLYKVNYEKDKVYTYSA